MTLLYCTVHGRVFFVDTDTLINFVPHRYIDTQNPDGSYTYGYESGDGTYKIETR